MQLSFGLVFEDLYSRDGLEKLHAEFLKNNPPQDMLERAKAAEDFLAELFNIRNEVAELKSKHDKLAPIFSAKKLFVQRAMKKYLKSESQALSFELDDELDAATKILRWMDEKDDENLVAAAHYLQENSFNFPTLMRLPKKLDFENLVHKCSATRERENFNLTDDGGTLTRALDQANYCIFCHERDKDSCSKGLWEDDATPKISPTKTPLAGCPLDEKISEMNLLKSQGFSIAALAVVTLDNPMCAATGHRICNDCM